jgi:hypothetical protein
LKLGKQGTWKMANMEEVISEDYVFNTIDLNVELIDKQLERENSESVIAFLNGQRYALLSLKRSLEYR